MTGGKRSVAASSSCSLLRETHRPDHGLRELLLLTVNNAYQFQNKVGWKVPGDFTLVPKRPSPEANGIRLEKSAATCRDSKLGDALVVVSLSAGAIHDQQLGNAKYVGVNLYCSF